MMFLDVLRKQGGFDLLGQFVRSGTAGTAAMELVLLGKSRTALEIIRLVKQLKTKDKLEKQYRNVLDRFDRNFDASLPHVSSGTVWFCWLQGLENAPELVQKCYGALCESITDRDIVLLTGENLFDYVQMPEYIVEKWKKGIISNAHFCDLVRLELLVRYGGTWIDSTVFVSSGDIPSYMLDSDLFLFQCLKPGKDGHTARISNWFMTATSNNKLLMAVRELLYAYWKNNGKLIDYYLFHLMFDIVIDHYPEDWKKVVPFSNSVPHILLLRLFESYDEMTWNAIKQMTPIHKLSYKNSKSDRNKKGTYYDFLFG